MADTTSGNNNGILKLILVPSLITLAITILRLVGELQGWPAPFFVKQGGGGGAIVGISWLPIIFGPYFALKLARAGDWPESLGKTFGFWAVGLVLMVAGGIVTFKAVTTNSVVFGLGEVVLMIGAFLVPLKGWSKFTKVLIAYAYASRIPVLIVMFLAYQGKWGTHYDAMPPGFPSKGFATDFLILGIFPQMFLWIAFTVVAGSLFGAITYAIAGRRKPAAQAA